MGNSPKEYAENHIIFGNLHSSEFYTYKCIMKKTLALAVWENILNNFSTSSFY